MIIGFPYHEGAKRSGARPGADLGPDSFRRFVKQIGSLHNFEYNVDLKAALGQIADYGNIAIEDKPSLEDLQNKLGRKVTACLERGNKVFVVGGSRDLFAPVAKALLEQEGKKSLFVAINHSLDTKPLLQGDVAHSLSAHRPLLQSLTADKGKFLLFGANGINISQIDK